MKYTVKPALGGMCIGLSAALMMLSSVIPFLTYAIPAIEKARQMLTESNKTNEEETEQTLSVFRLKELEILVEQIAKKMTGR